MTHFPKSDQMSEDFSDEEGFLGQAETVQQPLVVRKKYPHFTNYLDSYLLLMFFNLWVYVNVHGWCNG